MYYVSMEGDVEAIDLPDNYPSNVEDICIANATTDLVYLVVKVCNNFIFCHNRVAA
jgi:hypothetical protein